MKKIIIVLFLLCVFILGFLSVKDTDFGWHYRCGNQFLTTSRLCLSNEFSYYLPNYKAYYSGHLYDILLALIYNHGGFIAVSLAGATILVLSAYIFIKLIKQELWIASLVFIAIYFLSNVIFGLGLRPQIVSFFFTLLVLYILQQKNRKFLYFIPPLFFIWVNTHIGFFIGLMVILFYLADHYLRLVYDRKKVTISDHVLLLVFFLSFIATFINPFSIHVYQEILNHAFAPLQTMIAEWVAPPLWEMTTIVIFMASGLVMIWKKKPFSFFYCLSLVFFGLLALKAVRNLPFFYTVFFYVLLNNVSIKFEKYFSLLIPIFVSALFLLLIIYIPHTVQFDTDWHTYCNEGIMGAYPCTALKQFPQLSGNVFANYEWGGFLIWQKPQIKVFVDGRMSAWRADDGTYPYQTYLAIIQTKPGWNEKLRQLKTDYLLIGTGTFLDLLLQKESQKYNWQEKYRDSTAVIYQSL